MSNLQQQDLPRVAAPDVEQRALTGVCPPNIFSPQPVLAQPAPPQTVQFK